MTNLKNPFKIIITITIMTGGGNGRFKIQQAAGEHPELSVQQRRPSHGGHDLCRQEYPNISLGTVYRNLSLLVETGEIRKITTDGADRFDATLTPHSHFICKSCGCVLDMMIPIEDPVAEVDRLWDEGDVEECRFEFRGVCKKCRKNKSQA